VTLSAARSSIDLFVPTLSTVTAVVMSLVFLVVATVIAIDRLRAFAMRARRPDHHPAG